MSTVRELNEEAASLRALERIKTKLADGQWLPHYRFTNVENRLLESVRSPAALGLEKRPLFPGAKHGDWRLATARST